MTTFYVVKSPQENYFDLFQYISELPFFTPAYGLRTDALRSLTSEDSRQHDYLLIGFSSNLLTCQELLDEEKKEQAALQIESIEYYRYKAPMHEVSELLHFDGMFDLQPVRDRLPQPVASHYYAANFFSSRQSAKPEIAAELLMNPAALLEYPPAKNSDWPNGFDLRPAPRHSLFVCVPILLGNLYKSQIYCKSDFDGWLENYVTDVLKDPNTGSEVDMSKVFICSGDHLVELCGLTPVT